MSISVCSSFFSNGIVLGSVPKVGKPWGRPETWTGTAHILKTDLELVNPHSYTLQQHFTARQEAEHRCEDNTAPHLPKPENPKSAQPKALNTTHWTLNTTHEAWMLAFPQKQLGPKWGISKNGLPAQEHRQSGSMLSRQSYQLETIVPDHMGTNA